MTSKSTKFSLYAIAVLFVCAAVVTVVVFEQSKIQADTQDDLSTHSVPFKVGENHIVLSRAVDLSENIIGLNGSLISIDEAKRRGVIEGIFDQSGRELNSTSLLVPNTSFIIKVKDISASAALFY